MTKRAAVLVGFLAAFVLVWEQLQSVRLGYRLEQMHVQVRDQENKNAYLRLEVERLRSPQWLSQAAQARLHMSPPSPEAVIVLGGTAVESASGHSKSWFLSRLFQGPRDYQ